MVSFILSVVHALTVPAITAGVRLITPAVGKRDYPVQVLNEFNRRNRRLHYLSSVMCLFFCSISTFLWTILLIRLVRLRDSSMPPHLLMVRLQSDLDAWGVPGLFLGIISGGWLVAICNRAIFSTEFCRLWQAAENHKTGQDIPKLIRLLSIWVIYASMIWVTLFLNWYTRLEEDCIVISPFFGLVEKKYTYDRIEHLVETTHLKAPNGNLVERTRYFVLFDDGESWCHDSLLRDPQPLVDLLKAKTGKQFKRVRFIEDVK